MKRASDFANDHAAAVQYLQRRPENTLKETALERLMKELVWHYRTVNTIEAELYSFKIVHELKPGVLHASPFWGEIFFSDGEEPETFDSLECFGAYVLARWW
jgi:hypothetical protein